MHLSNSKRKGLLSFVAGAMLLSNVQSASFIDDHSDGNLSGWTLTVIANGVKMERT